MTDFVYKLLFLMPIAWSAIGCATALHPESVLVSGGSGSAHPAPKPVEPSREKTVSESTAEEVIIPVDRTLFDDARKPFISHRGKNPFANYVAITLPASPAKDLLARLQSFAGEQLQSRGEAHVTAITPPEFHDVLQSKLRIDEIEAIARSHRLQEARLEPVCIGVAAADLEGKSERAYFVVVRSPDINRFRAAVEREFLRRGGKERSFDPAHYSPHVTIGFTRADLHEEQGAIKDARACWASVKISAESETR